MIEYAGVAALVLSAAAAFSLWRGLSRMRKKAAEFDALKEKVTDSLDDVRGSVEAFNAVCSTLEERADGAADLQDRLDDLQEAQSGILNRIESLQKEVWEIPDIKTVAVGLGSFDEARMEAFREMQTRLDAVCRMAVEMNGILQGILDRLFYAECFIGTVRPQGGLAEAMFANRKASTDLERKYEDILNGADESGRK